ncbi:MAG: RsiV family protein [Lachnospiraceae bacterium]|nr:RsiV family protein [Lachnospiraceae bacterium]
MKKFTPLLALCLSGTLIFSGCSLNKTSDKAEDNTSTEESTTDTTDTSSSQDSSEENGFTAIQPVITTNTISQMKDDGVSYLMHAQKDTICLDDESAQYYPDLNDALVTYSESALTIFNDNYENSLTYALSDYAEGYMDDGMYYEDTNTIHMERVDDQVFSFTENSSSFLGGAHGTYGTVGVTFDTQTGKQLELSDVFNTTEDVVSVLQTLLEENYPDTQFFDLAGTMQSYITDPDVYHLCWYMTSEGVTFVFNPYELASYADGMQTVQVTFNEHPELFKEDYSASTGAFVTNIGEDMITGTTLVDIDRDGTSEIITVKENYDEDMYASAEFTCGDNSYTLDEYYNSMEAKLVHTEDGRNYIYAFLHEDNDYTFLNVLELSDDGINLVGNMEANEPTDFSNYDDSSNPSWKSYPFVACQGFIFSTRLDALSTYSGTKTYTVSDDGMPTSASEFYNIIGGSTLTAKKDFSAYEADYSTNELGNECTITSGEKLTFFRTNGTDTVIFEKEDGTYVGVKYDSSEGESLSTINGEAAEDLLDGIMYAG